mgnify:CR=1 FL=1
MARGRHTSGPTGVPRALDRAGRRLAVILWVVAASGVAPPSLARADDLPEPQENPRVFATPTGWLLPDAAVLASSGISLNRGEPFFALSVGLADLAELDVTATRDGDRWLPSALFKLGLVRGALFSWQPAGAIGFRRSFGVEENSAQLYGVVTLSTRPVRVHLGGDVWQAEGPQGLLSPTVRPSVAVEWTPWIAPRSTVLLDFGWEPRFSDTHVTLGWRGDWGVRVRVLRPVSLELGVRMRQGDALAAPTVFVRLNMAVTGQSGADEPRESAKLSGYSPVNGSEGP